MISEICWWQIKYSLTILRHVDVFKIFWNMLGRFKMMLKQFQASMNDCETRWCIFERCSYIIERFLKYTEAFVFCFYLCCIVQFIFECFWNVWEHFGDVLTCVGAPLTVTLCSHNIYVEGLLFSCPWVCRGWLLESSFSDPPCHQDHVVVIVVLYPP